jgi:hypothetical protein
MADSTGEISLTGSNVISQVLFGVVIVIVVYLTLATCEFFYNSFKRMFKDRVELFPNTYVSGARMYTAIQDPEIPESKTIYVSDNQRSGIEFSYALFLYVRSDTFNNNDNSSTYYHILHKGYARPYPLLGPGIFCNANENTLRIYMNCFDTWNNFTDIKNIPVDKWFHLTVSCKGNTFLVYINGNLKMKAKYKNNTPPYQNFGNVYAFSGRKVVINKAITCSLDPNDPGCSGGTLSGVGTAPGAGATSGTGATCATTSSGSSSNTTLGPSIKGMISKVYYFSYALTYTEIQTLLLSGPSSKIEGSDSMAMTPYLSDKWWTTEGNGIN